MTVYTPILENGAGHSIYQMWLTAGSPLQSAEAGWTVDPGLNGDLMPHLFTYYTTNGYSQDGDNLGGYNPSVKGWVQSSATVFPGTRLVSSSLDHYVNRYDMLFMLWQGNWWFKLENEWVGYYRNRSQPGEQRRDVLASEMSGDGLGDEVQGATVLLAAGFNGGKHR
ncbi:MAG TPA: neprosin family prolyl endopeptidase, partial [Verrucomicrobiae bacterium]|nr:neprosin family prolyl endopeptidase [Verrucomicrobiae bacterium]